MLFLTPSVEIQKTIKIPLKVKGQRLRSCRQSLVISGGIITCSLTHISPSNITLWSVFTVRRVMQRTVLLSQFCLSVCPSVRCVYCDKTEWCAADILTSHQTAITSFLTPTLVLPNAGERCPLLCQIFAENDPPPSKNADFDRFPRIGLTFNCKSHDSRITSCLKYSAHNCTVNFSDVGTAHCSRTVSLR